MALNVPKTYAAHDLAERYQVEIDDSQAVLKVDHKRLTEIARRLLVMEDVVSASVSIALVDNDTIHELNQRYLQHDYATDVLSFLLEGSLADPSVLPLAKDAPRGRGMRLEGEIIVSVEMADSEAAKYGWRPHDELTLYVVHGLLHLCGYDDQTVRESRRMRNREREVLAHWNLTPHYSE